MNVMAGEERIRAAAEHLPHVCRASSGALSAVQVDLEYADTSGSRICSTTRRANAPARLLREAAFYERLDAGIDRAAGAESLAVVGGTLAIGVGDLALAWSLGLVGDGRASRKVIGRAIRRSMSDETAWPSLPRQCSTSSPRS